MFTKLRSVVQSNLKYKLAILFISGSILPMVIISSFLYANFHRSFQQKETNYILDKVQSVNDVLDQTFIDVEKKMLSVLMNEDVFSILNSPYDSVSLNTFKDSIRLENILKSVAPYTQDGYSLTILGNQCQAYTNGSSINLLEKMDGNLAQQAIKESYHTMLIGRAAYHNPNQKVLTFGKLIKSANQVIGVLLADVDIHRIENIFSKFQNTENKIFIFNHNSEIIYTNSDFDTANIPISGEISASDGSNTVEIDGVGFLSFSNKSTVSQCSTLILVPKKFVFHDSSILLIQGILVLLVIIVQTWFFSQLISKRISSQISSLNTEVIHFASSNQPITISPQSSDEIGQLTQGVIYMSREINQMILRVQEEERNKRKLEFKVLQSQINPHMIYNTLNTITSLAQIRNVQNIENVSTSFTQLLRIISKTEGDFITLEQELDYIQCYCTIKKYNLLQEISLRYDINQTLLKTPILKLLLQPFIENSIKHGFSHLTKPGIIHVRAISDDDYMTIIITDNGVGMDDACINSIYHQSQSPTNAYNSIGIKNTMQRMGLQYNQDCQFFLNSSVGHYTQISLTYPIKRSPQ